MVHRFHVHFRAATRPLMALGAVLAIGAALLVMVAQGSSRSGYPFAFGRAGYLLMLASMLVPTAAVLIVLVWRRVHVLHRHAQQHALAAQDAQRHYFSVLCEVVKALERRDKRLAGRSERIARLVGQLAPRLGLEERQTELLTMVAQVHDIGLLSVSQQVLDRPTGLGGSEFAAVKEHCAVGEKILRPLEFLAPVLAAVKYHHERMNGTGYPEGKRGEEIPLAARILAVADSYDSMTHDRPHRPALSSRQAVAELIRCTPSGYDGRCVAVLAEITGTQDLLAKKPAANELDELDVAMSIGPMELTSSQR